MVDMASNAPKGPPPPPPPLAGIGVAGVVFAGIAIWAGICGAFLSETSMVAGFMVLWYWAKVQHLDIVQLPATVLGGLVGIGLSWIMLLLVESHGGPGFAFGLLLLFIAIYLDMIAVMPLLFNASTMLFSLITAAPLIQLKVNWIELSLATIGGGVFFGAYVAGVMWLAAKAKPKAA
jgi:hypothetical protein